MHPGVGAIYDVDVSALIDLDIVGLDGEVADLHRRLARGNCNVRAADIRIGGRGWNVIAYLLRAEWISYIDRPHSCIEPRYKDQLSVEKIGEIFAAGVSAEATTPVAEVTTVLIDLVVGDDGRFGLVTRGPGCDIYKVDELAVTCAYTGPAATACFIDQDNEVPC